VIAEDENPPPFFYQLRPDERSSVLDLRSRWNVLLLIMAVTPMFGGIASAAPRSSHLARLVTARPSMNFGNVVVGDYTVVSNMLGNFTTAGITISQATVTGSGFTITGPAFPLTLAPGQQSALTVAFSPAAAGQATGSIVLANNGSSPDITVSLAATGVIQGALAASPSSISFGTVMVGKTMTQTETFSNIGGTNLTILQATPNGPGFQLNGLTLPLTLAPNQSTAFTVTFSPTTGGAASGNIVMATKSAGWVHDRRGHYNRGDTVPSASLEAQPKDTSDDQTLTIALSGMAGTSGQLLATPNIAFSNTPVGKSQGLPDTLTNNGAASITVSQVTSTTPGFSITGLSLPLIIAAGQSTSFTVVFSPQSAGSVSGNIAITSNGSNPSVSTALSGTGVAAGSLVASPSTVNFGSVQTGNSQTASETLTNSGGSSVTITQAAATGAGFGLSGITLPLTLAAGQSTSFVLTFAPQASGAVSGGVSISSNAANASLAIALSGTGLSAGSLAASPSTVSFGNIQVGNNKTASETLTNSGGSSVNISQVAATGAGFSVSGITLPLTLAAGQSTSFTIAFAPQTSGAVTGGVNVASNASNAALAISTSGTGITAGSLAASPSTVSFGSVAVSKNQTATETVTNSGGSSVTITQATASGPGFTMSGLTVPLTLASGQSASFSVAFAPQSNGSATGGVAITSNASNPTMNIGLTGTGVTAGTIAATQSSLSFGSVQVGSSTAASETITNTGGSGVTITQANLTGNGFSAPGLDFPLTLAAGQSFTFSTIFAPQTSGAVTGGISVVSNASNTTLAISLSGTGTAPGQLAVSPTTLSFGSVTVGASKSLNGSLSASGANVTISAGAASTSEFALSGISFPLTIAAGQSAPFTVTFTPQSSGVASAGVTFTSNGSSTTAAQSLSGTGAAAIQHQVALSWSASTSSVVGYNVYRGTVSAGPYTKINSAADAATTYTDTAISAGQTYYYLTTAINSAGEESTYSNEVGVTVPTP
jgi:Abnormal spindle-like microcephaly-assoc'd, ASPM-SPD-2-Hydin